MAQGVGWGGVAARRKWKTAERLLAALAALIAVIGGVIVTVKWIGKESPVEEEQKLVQQLEPGQTLSRAVQIMKDQPRCTRDLTSGNTLYQYNRKWERIQLLVDPANSVVSVGVFADSTDFRPSFPLGDTTVTINRDPYGKLGEPAFVFGYCGSGRGNIRMNMCRALGASQACAPSSFEQADSSPGAHATCLTSSAEGDFRKNTAIAAVIVTKQAGLISDMFQSPYEVAGGNE